MAEGRLSEWISPGVLASWVPRDAVDEAVGVTGKAARAMAEDEHRRPGVGRAGHGGERRGVRVSRLGEGRQPGGVSQGQGGDHLRVRVARAGAGRDRPVRVQGQRRAVPGQGAVPAAGGRLAAERGLLGPQLQPVVGNYYQVQAWVYYPLGGGVNIGASFTGQGATVTSTSVPAGVWTFISAVVTATATTGFPMVGSATSTANMLFYATAIVVIGQVSARQLGSIISTISATAPKHTAAIFTKLDLQQSDDDNRRVLAVLAYLGEQ